VVYNVESKILLHMEGGVGNFIDVVPLTAPENMLPGLARLIPGGEKSESRVRLLVDCYVPTSDPEKCKRIPKGTTGIVIDIYDNGRHYVEEYRYLATVEVVCGNGKKKRAVVYETTDFMARVKSKKKKAKKIRPSGSRRGSFSGDNEPRFFF